MKLKYYLRGLGIGMVVTVLILGLAPGKPGDSAMTDAQIIARAKELGMVERKVLSDTVQPEVEDEENDVSDTDEEPETLDESTEPHTQAIGDTDDGGEIQTPEEQQAATQPEEPSAEDGDGQPGEPFAEDGDGQMEGVSDPGTETVRVEIVHGDSSNTACRKLKEAGLIADEAAYNSFLCENGYDKSILANTYEIPLGMSESEIAALITGH